MGEMTVSTGLEAVRCHLTAETLLADVLRQSGIHLPMPCGGAHNCGKCKIQVSGSLSPVSNEERAFLTPSELAGGYRMACLARVMGDVSVWPPHTQSHILSLVTLPPHQLTERGYGLAVDIGTTTIAMQLYCMEQGTLLSEVLQPNHQSVFGADIISRIDRAGQPGGAALSEILRNQLAAMATECKQLADVSGIDAVVVTGNTTMLHFWEGLDAAGISVAPFTPASLFGCVSTQPLADAAVVLPPCLGAYIGADITCAILASDLMRRPEQTALLIDLGTNGELVLQQNGRLSCASTAMGPAFEGAMLSCGMQAADGAISALTLGEDGRIAHTLVRGTVAKGICGSGVLDALALLLRLEIVDETGRLDPDATGVKLWNGQTAWQIPRTEVFITQQDIRQIQLAKAAICAGIQTLLADAALAPEDISAFYVAGGFGHSMNPISAAEIGLFPRGLAPVLRVLGNAALSGAVLQLLDCGTTATTWNIQSAARELPLSGNPTFSENYINSMLFELQN